MTASAPTRLTANDPCWCGSGRKYKRCHRAMEGRVTPGAVSAPRPVPESIPRPDYVANGGQPPPRPVELIRTPDVIERIRVASRLAAEILAEAGQAVRPGVTTDEIDALVHDAHMRRRVYPSPLGYHGYPKSVCTSVNEVICHGIPDSRPLADGDIVNLDVTVYREGVHGDTNATFLVGAVDAESRRLVEVTRQCLDRGIAAVQPGRPISDIGRAIEDHARRHRCGVVRAFVGHGVGEVFHCAPSVPHFYDPAASLVMREGMTFTIEPMITLGTWRHQMWEDGWTAVTADGSRCAQFEHTLVVTSAGADVLTALP